MQDTFVTMRFVSPLKEKLEAMAKAEQRTVTEQAVHLMENGLLILEQQQTQTEKERAR